MLGPLPDEEEDALDHLIAIGAATPATGDLLDLTPPIRVDGPPMSEILDDMRADRV